MVNGKALVWPRMKNARSREPLVSKPHYRVPGDAILLAAATECPPPPLNDLIIELLQRVAVRRHGVVVKVALDDIAQPLAGFVDWPVPALPQPLGYRHQLRPHAVAPGLPFDQEASLA